MLQVEAEEFAETFLQELNVRLNKQEVRESLFLLIQKRLANEKLLQLEIMHTISKRLDVSKYLPEKRYPERGKCDFWFETIDGTQFWMEIKMRPANYDKGQLKGRAITHGVEEIIADVGRLRSINDYNSQKIILFAFYPLKVAKKNLFDAHLQRIYDKIGKPVGSPKIEIAFSNGSFCLFSEFV